MSNLLAFLVPVLYAPLGASAEYLALALLAMILITFIRVRRSLAYNQQPNQVVERGPGQRLLGAPLPALPFAKEDLDFALLSQVAYDAARKGRQPGSRDAAADLAAEGWKRWPAFGQAQGLPTKLEASHLRVEIWVHDTKNCVAVAFAGTVFTNVKDWLSNLRWFIPFHEDEYTETVHVFGPAFVSEFITNIRPTMKDADSVVLFCTGHSLGGGLAQQLAYALPACALVPRVKKVYAFDPSPVTGYFSVSRTLRGQNKKGLLIDRIYERGEILAYIRSITNFIHKPSAINAEIRQIRYYLFKGSNPVYRHSIPEFAKKLWQFTNSTA